MTTAKPDRPTAPNASNDHIAADAGAARERVVSDVGLLVVEGLLGAAVVGGIATWALRADAGSPVAAEVQFPDGLDRRPGRDAAGPYCRPQPRGRDRRSPWTPRPTGCASA